LRTYKIFVFDAYGTLFDVNSAVARCREQVGPQADRLSELWRSKQLEYTWVRTLMNSYRDFGAITGDALSFAVEKIGGLSAELQTKLLDAYNILDAFEDVRPNLSALKALGHQTAILSNGTMAMLEHACAASGITPLIDAILSVDQIGAFKTDRRVYDMVVMRFNCAPNEVSFQSSNRWDVAAAARYGFRTVWVNRGGQPDEYCDHAPALTIRSLTELAN
jgi:2-haloacid dehalogenase